MVLGLLTPTTKPVRNACPAGYKGIRQDGHYPSPEFLAELNPAFAGFVAAKLDQPIGQLGAVAGRLNAEAAAWTGLPTRPDQDSQARVLRPPSPAAPLNLAATAEAYQGKIADGLREASRPERGSSTAMMGSGLSRVKAQSSFAQVMRKHLARLRAFRVIAAEPVLVVPAGTADPNVRHDVVKSN